MDKKALKFSLVNVLNWNNATQETVHGTLPTTEFLDNLVDLIIEEYEAHESSLAND